MTDNSDFTGGAADVPPPRTETGRPPLRRSREDRVIGGVAAGFGRWLGVDPVVVRVVLVVLAIFGGSGLLLYAAGWLFIPEEGAPTNEAQRLLDQTGRPGSTGRIVITVVAVCLGLVLLTGAFHGGPWHGFWFFGGGGSVLLLLAAGGAVVWMLNRDTASRTDATVAATAGTAVAPESVGYSYGGQGGYPGYSAAAPVPTPIPTPPSPPEPKPRSYLGAATLSIALLAVGTLVTLDATDVAAIPAVVVLAIGLGVLGLGLLVGTVFGRARWLLAIAIPLLSVTAIVAVIPSNLRLGTEFGDRAWRPTAAVGIVDDFRVDVGRGQLDLSDLSFPAGVSAYPVSASMGIGELDILVPEGVRVLVHANVGAGRIAVEGLPEVSGPRSVLVDEMPGTVGPDAPTITLTAEVGLGNLEVSRA